METMYGAPLATALMNIFTSNLYKNPFVVYVMEAIGNAADANTENNRNINGVKVEIFASGKVSITDQGKGLTRAQIDRCFLNIGNSTKKDSNTMIGEFGLGGKAAVQDGFALTTKTKEEGKVRYDIGTESIEETALSRIAAKVNTIKETLEEGEDTGTTIEFQIPLKNLPEVVLNVYGLQARQKFIPGNKESFIAITNNSHSTNPGFARVGYTLDLSEFVEDTDEAEMLQGVVIHLMDAEMGTTAGGISLHGGSRQTGGVVSLYSKTEQGYNGGFAFNLSSIEKTWKDRDGHHDLAKTNNLIMIPVEIFCKLGIQMAASRENFIENEALRSFMTILNRVANEAVIQRAKELSQGDYSYEKRVERHRLLSCLPESYGQNIGSLWGANNYTLNALIGFDVNLPGVPLFCPPSMSDSLGLAKFGKNGVIQISSIVGRSKTTVSPYIRKEDSSPADSDYMVSGTVSNSNVVWLNFQRTKEDIKKTKLNAYFLINDLSKVKDGRDRLMKWLNGANLVKAHTKCILVRSTSKATGEAMVKELNTVYGDSIPAVYASDLAEETLNWPVVPKEEFGKVTTYHKGPYHRGSLQEKSLSEDEVKAIFGRKVFLTKEQIKALHNDHTHLLAKPGVYPAYCFLSTRQINAIEKQKTALKKRGLWEIDGGTDTKEVLSSPLWLKSWVSLDEYLKEYVVSKEVTDVLSGETILEHGDSNYIQKLNLFLIKVFNKSSDEEVVNLRRSPLIGEISKHLVKLSASYGYSLARLKTNEAVMARLEGVISLLPSIVLTEDVRIAKEKLSAIITASDQLHQEDNLTKKYPGFAFLDRRDIIGSSYIGSSHLEGEYPSKLVKILEAISPIV